MQKTDSPSQVPKIPLLSIPTKTIQGNHFQSESQFKKYGTQEEAAAIAASFKAAKRIAEERNKPKVRDKSESEKDYEARKLAADKAKEEEAREKAEKAAKARAEEEAAIVVRRAIASVKAEIRAKDVKAESEFRERVIEADRISEVKERKVAAMAAKFESGVVGVGKVGQQQNREPVKTVSREEYERLVQKFTPKEVGKAESLPLWRAEKKLKSSDDQSPPPRVPQVSFKPALEVSPFALRNDPRGNGGRK